MLAEISEILAKLRCLTEPRIPRKPRGGVKYKASVGAASRLSYLPPENRASEAYGSDRPPSALK